MRECTNVSALYFQVSIGYGYILELKLTISTGGTSTMLFGVSYIEVTSCHSARFQQTPVEHALLDYLCGILFLQPWWCLMYCKMRNACIYMIFFVINQTMSDDYMLITHVVIIIHTNKLCKTPIEVYLFLLRQWAIINSTYLATQGVNTPRSNRRKIAWKYSRRYFVSFKMITSALIDALFVLFVLFTGGILKFFTNRLGESALRLGHAWIISFTQNYGM